MAKEQDFRTQTLDLIIRCLFYGEPDHRPEEEVDLDVLRLLCSTCNRTQAYVSWRTYKGLSLKDTVEAVDRVRAEQGAH